MSGSSEEDNNRDIFDTEDDLEYESDILILPQYAKEVASALKAATPIREKSLNSIHLSCDTPVPCSKVVSNKCDPTDGFYEVKSLLHLLCKKVNKNERCLKELQASKTIQ